MVFKKHPLNYLDQIPDRIITEFDDDGEKITLHIPKFKSAWMRKWLIPPGKPKYLKIRLDKTGSMVWKLIDGNITVNDICKQLQVKFPETHKTSENIELKVIKFLNMLIRNKLIQFKALKEN